jgi:enamine deaminase RidA (YjgF/YER057c/UK114 family)
VAIADGDTIFVSGIFAEAAKSAPEQVEEIFATLTDALKNMGGDLRHLVKATYYVSDDESSRALNNLRPNYYDAERPPAASKALVRGVGRPKRTVTLDMIAVPAQ